MATPPSSIMAAYSTLPHEGGELWVLADGDGASGGGPVVCWPVLAEEAAAREDQGMVSVPGWKPAGLRGARKASHLTQAELASRLKVPRELIGRWETRGAPRAERVAQLMSVLGVDLAALVNFDNPFTERRLRAGLSQQRLADLARVPRSTVQMLEAARSSPSSQAVRAVETVLGDAQAEATRSAPHTVLVVRDADRSPPTRRPRGRTVPSPSAAADVRWRPDALRKARKAAGLTQAELAASVGVTREAVGRWEAGTAPRLDRISAVASALGLKHAADLVERPEANWASLAAIRVHAGLTQRRLAERSGLPRSSIQAVERGAFHPSAAMIGAYAEVCGVPVSAVLKVVARKV